MLSWFIIGFAGVLTIFYDYLDLFKNTSFVNRNFISIYINTCMVIWTSVYTSAGKQKTSIPILFNVSLQMLAGGSVMLVLCFISGNT